MLMAWEAVFAFSYLGYIELPAISTTTLHILVIVAAMMLGAQGSVPVVCVFVVTSMWIGTYSLSQLDRVFSPFASGMPLGSIMLVFCPRAVLRRGAGLALLTFYFSEASQVCLSGHCGDCGCQHPSSWAVRFCRVILQFPYAAANDFRKSVFLSHIPGLAVLCPGDHRLLRHPLGSDSEVGEKQIVAAMRLSSGNARVRKPEAADLFGNRCGSGGHSVHPVSAKGHLQGAVPARHRCQRKPTPKYHRLFAANAGGSVGAL